MSATRSPTRAATSSTGWFATPVLSSDRPRDELAIKLALAVTVPGVDVGAVIQRQRGAAITAMQDLTRLKKAGPGDLSWSLVLESMRYQLEAEVRWLDHCEALLARTARDRASLSLPASRSADATTTGAHR